MDEQQPHTVGPKIAEQTRKRKRDEEKGNTSEKKTQIPLRRSASNAQISAVARRPRNNKGRKLRKPEEERDILKGEVLKYLKEEREADNRITVSEYYKRRSLEESSKDNPKLPSRSCFFEGVKKTRAGEELRKRGRRGALTEKEEDRLEENVKKFESEYRTLTNNVIKQEAGSIVAKRLGSVDIGKMDDSQVRDAFQEIGPDIKSVFGRRFVYRMRKKRFSLTKTNRGMEIARARKYQPEICLDWFRLYLHTCALRQIQVHVHPIIG